MKEKYITVDFHFNDLWREFEDKYNINPAYWVPDRFLKIINFLEEKYPDYEYHSFSPAGSGGYQPFVVLKLKIEKITIDSISIIDENGNELIDKNPDLTGWNIKESEKKTLTDAQISKLAEIYGTNNDTRVCVAQICDEVLDRTGELLGIIRDKYRKTLI